jgi:hypothetical protein
MRHIATHLAGLEVLLAAFLGAGALIEHVARPLRAFHSSVGLVRLTLGIIVWIYLVFACSVLGLLRMPVIGAFTGLTLVVALLVLWRDRRVLVGDVRGAGLQLSRPTTTLTRFAPLAAPVLVLLALFFLSLSSSMGWDDNVYHLALPRLYVAYGGFRRVPFNIYSNWPLNTELLYALAMIVQDYILAKLVHLTFLVLTVVAVYRLASAHSSRLGGSLAAMLLLANPAVLNEARFAYIDIAFAFFFLMAFVFALQHLDERRTLPLLLSGLCCGVVAGTKLTGAVAAPCIGLLVVVSRTAPPRLRELRAAARDVVLCVALPAFALAIPWYIRSYAYTGNPFYPFFYQWFGGPEWSIGLERQFLDWQQSIGMGRRFVDYLWLPVRVALESHDDYAHFGARLNPLWIGLVPLGLVFAPSVQVVRRTLGVAGLYFVAWALTSQQARFLIPMLPLLAVAAGVAVTTALEKVRHSTFSPGHIAAVVSLLLLWPARFVLAEGLDAARKMVGPAVAVPGDAKAPVYHFIGEQLPPTARLMMLNTNFGFFVDREYVADSFFEASQMNALVLDGSGGAVGISRRLRERGITHVLLARTDWQIPYPRALWEFLADRGLTQLIYTSPDGQYLLFHVMGIS